MVHSWLRHDTLHIEQHVKAMSQVVRHENWHMVKATLPQKVTQQAAQSDLCHEAAKH